MTSRSILLGAAVTLAVALAQAQSFKAGPIDIGHPWARATVAGQPIGGAYFSLDNHGADDRLVSVSAPVSASAEMHVMSMAGNVMKMRQVDDIALPAGKVVELKPGAYHIMLIGLKAPLKAGDSFPLTLKFEKAGQVDVTVKVEAPTAAAHEH